MRTRFAALWTRLSAHGNPNESFNRLIHRYREPHRFYHDVTHLEFGLQQFDLISDVATWPDDVEFAFFYHDSIYEIGAGNNEERSAELAGTVLWGAGVSDVTQNRVEELIRMTKPGRIPTTPNECVMGDIDLAILGQPHALFTSYEMRVRAEYAVVPDDVFWTARIKILQGFVDRPNIFFTKMFQDYYEQQARANLAFSISSGENIINRS